MMMEQEKQSQKEPKPSRRQAFFSVAHFREALATIKEWRRFILVAFLLAAVTFIVISFHPGPLKNIMQQAIASHLGNWFETVGHSAVLLYLFIFINNALAMYLFMILGVFFTLPTIWSLLLNAALIAVAVNMVREKPGFTQVMLLSIPHAALELPAYFISMGAGLRLGLSWLGDGKKARLKENFRRANILFAHLILPLLLLAALLETTVIMLNK